MTVGLLIIRKNKVHERVASDLLLKVLHVSHTSTVPLLKRP